MDCVRLFAFGSRACVLAVFNDVRPAGSPPLTWYLNVTIRVVPNATVAARALRPSKVVRLRHLNDRASWFASMPVPPDRETVAIMEGVWNFSGYLINDPVLSHLHAHMEMLHTAYLFGGSAQELGLDMAALGSDSGCSPVSPARGGFASNDAMLRALKSRCPRCFEHGRPSGTRLLCVANASVAQVGQYAYDRRATLDCGASLRVRVNEGERFTSLTFLGPRPETFAPGTQIPNASGVDGYFSQHTFWDFSAYSELAEGGDGPDLRTYLPLLQAPNARLDRTMCGISDISVESYGLPLGDGRYL